MRQNLKVVGCIVGMDLYFTVNYKSMIVVNMHLSHGTCNIT